MNSTSVKKNGIDERKCRESLMCTSTKAMLLYHPYHCDLGSYLSTFFSCFSYSIATPTACVANAMYSTALDWGVSYAYVHSTEFQAKHFQFLSASGRVDSIRSNGTKRLDSKQYALVPEICHHCFSRWIHTNAENYGCIFLLVSICDTELHIFYD